MKEALKLALELAIMHHSDDGYAELRSKVRQLAKEALAQPEQEPVQKRPQNCGSGYCSCIECVMELEQEPSITKTGCGILTLHLGFDDLPDGTKFYTTPPKRPWVGLTDEEVDSLQRLAIDPVDASGWGFLNRERYARLIEVKLKEKNT